MSHHDPSEQRTPIYDIGRLVLEGFRPVTIDKGRDCILARYYPADKGTGGIIWVGGVGGGFDTPARALYPRLCREFSGDGVASLRVRFRISTNLNEAADDVLCGIAFLQSQGITRHGLVGHSFGGAAVLRAAAMAPSVRAVVTLATQSHGAGAVGRLSPRCALLIIHGDQDPILPPSCSLDVFRQAGEPKTLRIFEGAGHTLDEASEGVHLLVGRWLKDRMTEEPARPDKKNYQNPE